MENSLGTRHPPTKAHRLCIISGRRKKDFTCFIFRPESNMFANLGTQISPIYKGPIPASRQCSSSSTTANIETLYKQRRTGCCLLRLSQIKSTHNTNRESSVHPPQCQARQPPSYLGTYLGTDQARLVKAESQATCL